MKILILSSGGDAPGMNKFIWQIFSHFKTQTYFAYAGFSGLVNNQIFPLSEVAKRSLQNEAGTMIKSSRLPEFKQPEVFKLGLEVAKGFDCVLIIGGNGSQCGAKELYQNGVNTIFIPGTIDNDVDDCAYSIGFLTAVKEGVYAVKNSMPSIESFGQTCLFEVMGREDDAICRQVANEVGADYAVCDKKSLDFEKIKNVILKNFIKSKSSCIVVRENIMPVEKIAEKLNHLLGSEMVKFHIVGRTQRGGKPTREELALAKKYADATVKCIKTKTYGVRVLADESKNIVIKQFV